MESEKVQPTEPLPKEVSFPLVENGVGEEFKMIVLGNAQVYTEQEVEYYRNEVVKEL